MTQAVRFSRPSSFHNTLVTFNDNEVDRLSSSQPPALSSRSCQLSAVSFIKLRLAAHRVSTAELMVTISGGAVLA